MINTKELIYILTFVIGLNAFTSFAVSATTSDQKITPTKPVPTSSGIILGKKVTADGDTINAYLGIKYGVAERWKRSLLYQNPYQIIKAYDFGKSCPQDPSVVALENQSEDCLYLNIWQPNKVSEKLPVLVFIHGGSFVFGSGGTPNSERTMVSDGVNLAKNNKVIVVTLNYRLGALGFLDGGKNAGFESNRGIYDQRLALQWLQKNIAKFGGDPNKVTVFGESAGAYSIALYSSAPTNLFRSAIIESSPYGLLLKNKTQTQKLYNKFVTLANGRSLNDLSAAELVTIGNSSAIMLFTAQMGLAGLMPWSPYLDNELVMTQPGNVKINVPVIAGITGDEGILFAESSKKITNPLTYRIFLALSFGPRNALKILNYSKYRPSKNLKAYDALNNLFNDYLYACPTRHFLSNATSAQKFAYLFAHVPSFNIWPTIPACAEKSCHGAELPFIFGNAVPFNNTPSSPEYHFTDDELILSSWMGTVWSNFAKTNDPNLPKLNSNYPQWPAFSSPQNLRLIFEVPFSNPPTTGDQENNCGFWDSIGYGKYFKKQ